MFFGILYNLIVAVSDSLVAGEVGCSGWRHMLGKFIKYQEIYYQIFKKAPKFLAFSEFSSAECTALR